MRKRSHITVVEGETENVQHAEPETLELQDEVVEFEEWEEDEPVAMSRRGWIVPTIAGLATTAWTAFFGYANRAEILAGGTIQQWSGWISAWAVPVLLIVSLWILSRRNSTVEARRFGEVSRSLAEESARLEARLAVVNRELSLAREFLGSQSRELEFLGRSASERLSEHADKLQGLVLDNGHQVDQIATVSATALENITRLRDNLPVIANSAKDVSNQIGGAGRSAQEQLDKLVSGFERLNEFGAASERQVKSLQTRVDEALEAFTAQASDLERIGEERFAALRETSEEARAELDVREIEALAAIRARSEALRSELAEAQQTASAEEELALAAMRDRFTGLRVEAAQLAGSIRKGEEHALEAWTGQVEGLRKRLTDAISEIERMDAAVIQAATERVQVLYERAETINAKIDAHGTSLDNATSERLAALRGAQDDIARDLELKLAAIDEAVEARRAAHRSQLERLTEESEALAEKVAALGSTFDTVREQGREAGEDLDQAVTKLADKLTGSREALDGTDTAVARLTDASVRLLELIQASARHSREDLPVAMKASEDRLEHIEQRTADIRSLLDQARASGDQLTQGMEEIERRTREAIDSFENFQSGFGETAAAQVDSVERLRAGIAALRDESAQLAERVQSELSASITELEDRARTALEAVETEDAERIARLAKSVGERSSEAIDKALAEHTDEALARLDEARQRSTEAARSSAKELRDQLARLNELTVNLEARIAHARDKITDSVDGDFARRVALITESLNSNSIDIAKALSTDVTDTAWASYLRGDRGIFTRRAVKLIDNGQAREIAELYDEDTDFREHVNRYIHDFEAMLRNLLSTRDGNALSVTLLSSDMGKLYVVMAQALERLRQ